MTPTAPSEWEGRSAPTLDDLERLGIVALDGLPAEFRALAADAQIRVDEFPDEEALRELGLESEFDLLGLFQGQGMAQAGATPATGTMPNMIWLYRRPILDYWAEHDDSLGAIVSHVLIHEIGHHFGLSDEDMEAIEASVS